MSNVYELRRDGLKFLDLQNYDGSDHYKLAGCVEPFDLMVSMGTGKEYCVNSIVKYVGRIMETRSLEDIRKLVDCGVILAALIEEEKSDD